MLVTTPENYAATRRRRFTVQGVKSRHRRRAETIAPGDRICWYLVGIGGFAATATVSSPVFEAHEPIWISTGSPDAYPWRFRIRPDVVRRADRAVPARDLVGRLRFTRPWPAAHWRLAFQGNLHLIPAADFAVIERAVGRPQGAGC
ncbi:MAG TPA: hypothetical protein VM070_01900 [Candidatus Saccharimonadales bacterium]|nr:hypothetical protein [Candidatus Saccharimonadales bacterium]